MDLKSFLRDNRTFFVLCILLFLVGSYPLVVFDKVTLLLRLNSLHHAYLDQCFYYITYLGSTTMYVLLMATLVVMGRDMRTLLTGLSSFVATASIVQGLKHIMFFDQLRPIALITTDVPLHLVAGIVPATHFSFPSGHAATIFVAVCFIHLLVRKPASWMSVLLLLGATIVAYSRVYLCQHFYRDIYVGALVGTWTTIFVYGALMHWKGPAWLDQTLFDLLL